MSYIVAVAALDKIFEIDTFDCCSLGWSGQKSFFGLLRRKRRELENNLNIFETCVLNPFNGQKIKESFFSDGKSRGPLLAGAALKHLK